MKYLNVIQPRCLISIYRVKITLLTKGNQNQILILVHCFYFYWKREQEIKLYYIHLKMFGCLNIVNVVDVLTSRPEFSAEEKLYYQLNKNNQRHHKIRVKYLKDHKDLHKINLLLFKSKNQRMKKKVHLLQLKDKMIIKIPFPPI